MLYARRLIETHREECSRLRARDDEGLEEQGSRLAISSYCTLFSGKGWKNRAVG